MYASHVAVVLLMCVAMVVLLVIFVLMYHVGIVVGMGRRHVSISGPEL
jgi:hypothetical protein